MSIAAPASSHPRLGSTQHYRSSSSSSSSPPTKAVRFAPYATTSPSAAALFGRSSSHSRSPSRSRSPQHLEVHVRVSKSPSPSALSSDSYSDSDMQDVDRKVDSRARMSVEGEHERARSRSSEEWSTPSPTPRDSVSTVSECESEASGGAEVVAMHRLALSGRPTRPILKPTARRAKPPAPLRPYRRDHREHRRAHSFSSLASQLNPATVGYMLCPSPRSAGLDHSQRDIQAQAQRDDAKGLRSTVYPAPSQLDLPHFGRPQNHQGARSPRSPLASRSAGLDTISETLPLLPTPLKALAPLQPQVLPARRHSTYYSTPLPVHAPLHIRRTPSPSNDPSDGLAASGPASGGAQAYGPQMSLERMMLVNPSIAAHLKRGGVVSVRSVDGKKSWKIRIPEEQLSAMRMRA